MFEGEVLRVLRYNFEGKFSYEAGILYKKIENIDREAIIGFIFSTQRKLRKKGMI
jgi:c-di-GMP-binding flagellar brake protein YcgR